MQWRPPRLLPETLVGYSKVMEVHLREPQRGRPILDSFGDTPNRAIQLL
jgi:hypothetical protein